MIDVENELEFLFLQNQIAQTVQGTNLLDIQQVSIHLFLYQLQLLQLL